MAIRCARSAGAGGNAALHRARVRTDHGGRDRRTSGAYGANVLSALCRQARGAIWGSAALQELLVSTLASAPDSAAPIDAIAVALEAAGVMLQERRDYSRQRQAIIAANAELQERELIKLATLASACADALRQRGVRDPGRESDCRGRDRGLQNRVRTLDQ